KNLQIRYEWFIKWKDLDLDYTKNCVFIDKAGFCYRMEIMISILGKDRVYALSIRDIKWYVSIIAIRITN
ncbi:hypothetical protein BCV71DRAFT_189376, partial [Rhizopus microsporus]